MKKNNKGFTLIELLAIIVILAIIAVITIPILLNVIENSRKGASIDSAYGFRDSIQQYYLAKSVENTSNQLPTGVYDVNTGLPSDFGVSGTKPSDGWVKLEQGQVVDYSLKFGDYVVTYDEETKSPLAIKNGDLDDEPVETFATLTDDADENNEISIGDLVCINDTEECFYVISNENGTTAMLAKYNLLVGSKWNNDIRRWEMMSEDVNGYGLQNSSALGDAKNISGAPLGGMFFSKSPYWNENLENYIDSYVFDENSNLYEFVNNYGSFLEKITNEKINARLMTYEETTKSGIDCTIYEHSCKDWISNTSFWLGTASSNNSVYSIISKNEVVNSYSFDNVHEYDFGVRPVIEIPTSTIQLKSE